MQRGSLEGTQLEGRWVCFSCWQGWPGPEGLWPPGDLGWGHPDSRKHVGTGAAQHGSPDTEAWGDPEDWGDPGDWGRGYAGRHGPLDRGARGLGPQGIGWPPGQGRGAAASAPGKRGVCFGQVEARREARREARWAGDGPSLDPRPAAGTAVHPGARGAGAGEGVWQRGHTSLHVSDGLGRRRWEEGVHWAFGGTPSLLPVLWVSDLTRPWPSHSGTPSQNCVPPIDPGAGGPTGSTPTFPGGNRGPERTASRHVLAAPRRCLAPTGASPGGRAGWGAAGEEGGALAAPPPHVPAAGGAAPPPGAGGRCCRSGCRSRRPLLPREHHRPSSCSRLGPGREGEPGVRGFGGAGRELWGAVSSGTGLPGLRG